MEYFSTGESTTPPGSSFYPQRWVRSLLAILLLKRKHRAQALLIRNCCWEPSHLAGFNPLPWPTQESLDTGQLLSIKSSVFLLYNLLDNFIPCILFRSLRSRVEILPVMGDTAIDWETSARVFNTGTFRQDAAGLEEEGKKYLQNTSFVRGKAHQLE